MLLSQLEREPDEPLVDPWVVERRTLVAIERDAVVAGAHLLRYGGSGQVGESYRGAGEIRWIVGRPDSPAALDTLIAESCKALDAWGVTRRYADGGLPAPFVYGIPENWPHVRSALERTGFVHEGHVELVLYVPLADLPAPGEPPVPGVGLARSVGPAGTRRSGASAMRRSA